MGVLCVLETLHQNMGVLCVLEILHQTTGVPFVFALSPRARWGEGRGEEVVHLKHHGFLINAPSLGARLIF
jgi:hypothetical protein